MGYLHFEIGPAVGFVVTSVSNDTCQRVTRVSHDLLEHANLPMYLFSMIKMKSCKCGSCTRLWHEKQVSGSDLAMKRANNHGTRNMWAVFKLAGNSVDVFLTVSMHTRTEWRQQYWGLPALSAY